jgi:hypothetical protein
VIGQAIDADRPWIGPRMQAKTGTIWGPAVADLAAGLHPLPAVRQLLDMAVARLLGVGVGTAAATGPVPRRQWACRVARSRGSTHF